MNGKACFLALMGGIVLMTGCSTDSQAASRPVPQFDANTKVIALTFDDGPSSTTPLVLDKLDQYGVVASFSFAVTMWGSRPPTR